MRAFPSYTKMAAFLCEFDGQCENTCRIVMVPSRLRTAPFVFSVWARLPNFGVGTEVIVSKGWRWLAIANPFSSAPLLRCVRYSIYAHSTDFQTFDWDTPHPSFQRILIPKNLATTEPFVLDHPIMMMIHEPSWRSPQRSVTS